MRWRTTCLRTERWEGGTREAGRPAGEVNAGRSQSPNGTDHGDELDRGEVRQSKRRMREVGQEG